MKSLINILLKVSVLHRRQKGCNLHQKWPLDPTAFHWLNTKKLLSLPLIQLKRSGTFLFLAIFEVPPLLLEGELPYFADKIIPAEKECACA